MKLYLKTHKDVKENDNYQTAFELKRLKIDISNTIERNMVKIKRDMDIEEIENALGENIYPLIENSALNDESESIFKNTAFKIKMLALRLKQSMDTFNRDAYSLNTMFFPNCLNDYMMKDEQLGLMGNCEKTEIVDGRYYPVISRNSKPPMHGVWDSEAIELVAYAILLEYDFDCDVYVGFVDYEKTGDRRVVIMDHNLRKGLFDVISEIKEIIDDNKVPNVRKNPKKCKSCEYGDICS